MEIISNYPWYYTLLCFVAGCIFSVLLYYRDKHHAERSKPLRYSLLAFRFLSISFICILLLDIFIKHLINETEKPIIIVAQDNSASIVANKDSASFKTNYTSELANFINAVKDKYEVKTYQFDSDFKPSEQFSFNGKETDLSNVFNSIENNYANQNIGAIIIASDGIYNKGTNPLYSIQKINAPIYTIALGDTMPLKDIWIQTINHNQVAYLGNSFPVEVVVNSVDLKDKAATLTISKNGKILKSENISINSNNFSNTYNFILDAEVPGVQKYTVNISAPNEDKNLQNNTQSFMIDVIDNREKILILYNAPHPDIAAIEQSISTSQTYEVDVENINGFTKPLKPYALIILHQPAIIHPRIVAELKNNQQSVLYIGSYFTNFLNNSAPNTIMANKANDVEASLKKEFALFSVSNELQGYFKEFPAVKCAFKSGINTNGINTLLAQKIGVVETEEPLLFFTEINNIKYGAFTGDGLWRWKLRDYADHENHNLFNELISKTVQYLSVKADKSFFRVYTKKIINENEPLDFTAEVYNQSYELVTEPDVTMTLKDESGKTFNYTFSKKQNMYQLSAGIMKAGEYTYEAKVKYGDKLFSKSGVVVIKEIVAEKLNTVANHQLLFQLAKESGGEIVYPNQLKKLEKTILESDNIKSITYSHKQLTDLVNLKWIFFLIIALLSTEWFLRKYNGKV